MTGVRSTRERVTDGERLLALTESSDWNDLEQEASVWAAPYGPHCLLTPDDEDQYVTLQVDNAFYAHLEYPFTLARFWRFVSDTYRVASRYEQILALPELETHGGGDVTTALADFFHVSLRTFVSHMGGGWRCGDPGRLPEYLWGEHPVERWYVSGRPAAVGLGLTAAYAVVADPTGSSQGEAADPSVHAVELDRRDRLRQIGAAAGAVQTQGPRRPSVSPRRSARRPSGR